MMQITPEKKLRYLSEYMSLWVDAWPDKSLKPFDRWLESTLDKKVNKGKHLMREHFRKACRYCGRQFEENYLDKTKDHIVPVSRGGFDKKENRVPCCYDCNQWKSDKSLEQWLKEVHRMVKKQKESRTHPLNLMANMIGRIKHVINYKDENIRKIALYKS